MGRCWYANEADCEFFRVRARKGLLADVAGVQVQKMSRGLIERLESEDRRNPYRLTALGQKALRARLAALETVTKTGQRRLARA